MRKVRTETKKKANHFKNIILYMKIHKFYTLEKSHLHIVLYYGFEKEQQYENKKKYISHETQQK
jgi:hypothetical protein